MVKNNVNSHNLINDIVLEEMDRVFIASSIIKYLKKNVLTLETNSNLNRISKTLNLFVSLHFSKPNMKTKFNLRTVNVTRYISLCAKAVLCLFKKPMILNTSSNSKAPVMV
jgi:hypothetical protein